MTLSQRAVPDQMYSLVDNNLVEVLLYHKNNCDRLMFARSENGQIKIEVKYGPLKCLVKRFVTNKATFERIRQEFSMSN